VDLLCRLERRDWYRSEPRHASILAAAGWLGDVQAVLDSLSVCRAIRLWSKARVSFLYFRL